MYKPLEDIGNIVFHNGECYTTVKNTDNYTELSYYLQNLEEQIEQLENEVVKICDERKHDSKMLNTAISMMIQMTNCDNQKCTGCKARKICDCEDYREVVDELNKMTTE